jgi:DNA-binding response OmpR family regulator
MDDVVSKPFRIGELIPKIEELAGRYPSGIDLKEPLGLVVPSKQAEAKGGVVGRRL